MTKFPAAPRTVNAPTVVVTFGKTIVCATVLVLAISENVFVPKIVVVDVLVLPPMVNLPYVFDPPLKFLALVVLFDRMISAVPVIVDVGVFQQVPDPVIVHDAVPKFTVPVAAARVPAVTE